MNYQIGILERENMLVLPNNVLSYISMWTKCLLESQNKQGLIVPITGGIDSAVCGALALTINPTLSVYFVKMGFKPNEEKVFEDWVKQKYGLYNDKVVFVDPIHPKLELGEILDNSYDIRADLINVYVSSIAKNKNLLSVGCVNKSEYSLVKEVGLDAFDCYPIVDLYRSEVVSLGAILGLPEDILKLQSNLEKRLGISFYELEWVNVQNEMSNIISSNENPLMSKFWGMYSQRQKEVIMKVHSYYHERKHVEFLEKKMCNVRKALPGLLS